MHPLIKARPVNHLSKTGNKKDCFKKVGMGKEQQQEQTGCKELACQQCKCA